MTHDHHHTQPQADPIPRNITIDRPNQLLIIEWEDGAYCEYPLPGIRYICPCAECRGGHEHMGKPIPPEDIFKTPPAGVSTELVDAKLVGSYGIQFFWADGHNAGLYTWKILRPLCPRKSR
jgi:DUF971 family protein